MEINESDNKRLDTFLIQMSDENKSHDHVSYPMTTYLRKPT